MPALPDYVRTSIPSFLSIKSIVTVLHVQLSGQQGGKGEAHDFPEIMYVNSGHHTLKIDGVPYAMEPEQMILYKPHSLHGGHLPSTATLNVISFEADFPDNFDFYNRPITLTGKQQKHLSQILSQGLDAFQMAPRDQGLRGMIPRADMDAYTLQQLKNQLELFLIDLYQTSEPARPHPVAVNQENFRKEQLETVTDYMTSHLSENLTLAQIAENCSMSISKLKLLFKEQCGCGPVCYFIQLKIQAAKKMICDSSMSFTQIAEQLGFGSVHYFSNLFKEKTGMTPSEYAKSLNKRQ